MLHWAAQAGETVTYTVGEEQFEGYRAAAKDQSKGLVLIIHDWDGLTDYEMKRADMLAGLGYDAFALNISAGETVRSRPLPRRKRQASYTMIESGCALSSSRGCKKRARAAMPRPW